MTTTYSLLYLWTTDLKLSSVRVLRASLILDSLFVFLLLLSAIVAVCISVNWLSILFLVIALPIGGWSYYSITALRLTYKKEETNNFYRRTKRYIKLRKFFMLYYLLMFLMSIWATFYVLYKFTLKNYDSKTLAKQNGTIAGITMFLVAILTLTLLSGLQTSLRESASALGMN